jgi:hypothetical protein
MDEFLIISDDETERKRYAKKLLKQDFLTKESEKAKIAITKFLEENPDINIDYAIIHMKDSILSTIKCAEKLGISPKAFLRLRKKYNIVPVSEIKNSYKSKSFAPHFSKKATKNFYSIYQLKRIPKSEIDLSQKRSGSNLKLGIKIKWKPRGYHSNGKLKARTDYLSKYGFFVLYNHKDDNYTVNKDDKNTILSKKEVDVLNQKYLRLKSFV